ncbi:MAG: hypothetical protein ACKPHU_00185, partial [Planctomycetaceae bacterium]
MGKFWQARYRAVRLLDEIAILSCAVYVDLNPIRASISQTIAESDFTSAQKRLLNLQSQTKIERGSAGSDSQHGSTTAAVGDDPVVALDLHSSQHLAPVELNEHACQIGADANRDGVRCSNKGFLPMSTGQYLALLEWTAGQQRVAKAGRKPKWIRRLFKRLGISASVWN